MDEPKMKETDQSVIEFIEQIDHPRKKAEAYQLLNLFTETTGYEGKMWGPSIIGFGQYHYTYESGREGDAPLVGFSPRKAKVSLYFSSEAPEREGLLADFGKHTTGKSCVYINKIADIEINILIKLINMTVDFVRQTYPDQFK